GQATITATDDATGLSSSDDGGGDGVLMVPGAPQSVRIFPRPKKGQSLTGSAGSTMQLKAKMSYQGGATQGVNALVKWESSDPTVVKVSNGDDGHPAGFAQLLKVGSVTIKITWPKSGPGATLTDSLPLAVH